MKQTDVLLSSKRRKHEPRLLVWRKTAAIINGLIWFEEIKIFCDQPDETIVKTSAFVAESMGFKFRADQTSHTLPTIGYRCKPDVWALAQSRGVFDFFF